LTRWHDVLLFACCPDRYAEGVEYRSAYRFRPESRATGQSCRRNPLQRYESRDCVHPHRARTPHRPYDAILCIKNLRASDSHVKGDARKAGCGTSSSGGHQSRPAGAARRELGSCQNTCIWPGRYGSLSARVHRC
jgi:hypothetical protein